MMQLVALLLVACSEARSVAHSGTHASIAINPPLEDVASDKKFFGPPFPADYPDDKRPKIDQKMLDKVRPAGKPYPQLQKASHFDSDYVKDENDDGGAWTAQFEYDTLRKELLEKEAAEKRAADNAAKEQAEADKAAKKAQDAANDVDKAKKDADAAGSDEGAAAKAESDEASSENNAAKSEAKTVEEAKKLVEEAEQKLEKQKAAFAECEKQLAQAKAELDAAKANLKAVEAKQAAEVKLWVEAKTKAEGEKKTAAEALAKQRKARENDLKLKHQAAMDRLHVAQKDKAILQKALAKEQNESNQAQEALEKQKAAVKQAYKDLDTAKVRLQGLRGITPSVHSPTKSGSRFAMSFNVLTLSWLFMVCMF
jgi:hypothetical protein